MKIGVARGSPAERLGLNLEPLANKLDDGSVRRHWAAEIGIGPLAPGGVAKCGAGFGEKGAIAHLEIALGWKIVGDENVLTVEFDVPVTDFVGINRDDGRAIDEVSNRDQHLAADIDADRMLGRKEKVSGRPVQSERAGGDSDGKHLRRVGMPAAIDLAMTDPLDRPRFAGVCHDAIAHLQGLDRDVAPRRPDERSRREANHCRRDAVEEDVRESLSPESRCDSEQTRGRLCDVGEQGGVKAYSVACKVSGSKR